MTAATFIQMSYVKVKMGCVVQFKTDLHLYRSKRVWTNRSGREKNWSN